MVAIWMYIIVIKRLSRYDILSLTRLAFSIYFLLFLSIQEVFIFLKSAAGVLGVGVMGCARIKGRQQTTRLRDIARALMRIRY